MNLIFANMNEEGELYEIHSDLDSAVDTLSQYPNDAIRVFYSPNTVAYHRYQVDSLYDLDHALSDGMREDEYINILS